MQHLEALINYSIENGLKPLTERRSKTALEFYDVYSTIQNQNSAISPDTSLGEERSPEYRITSIFNPASSEISQNKKKLLRMGTFKKEQFKGSI